MQVGMKKYPCCYLTQRIIDGVLDMVAEHRLSADDVVRVEIGVNRIFPQILKYPEPGNAEEARFSLPHIIASAISGETMSVETFTEEKVRDPRLVAQRSKVVMTIHDDWGNAQLGESNTISMTTRDGRVLERLCTTARGDPANPLGRDELLARFVRMSEGLMPGTTGSQAAETLARVETLDDVGPLMRLFATAE